MSHKPEATPRPATVEANFDGLVGPTHNYAGLAQGNNASAKNAEQPSNPAAAALQGLAKMRALAKLGLAQGVLPPQERPHIPTLKQLLIKNGVDLINCTPGTTVVLEKQKQFEMTLINEE